jgi:hypothetical protein
VTKHAALALAESLAVLYHGSATRPPTSPPSPISLWVPSALFLDDLYEVTHLGRRQRVLHEIAARCGRYVCRWLSCT